MHRASRRSSLPTTPARRRTSVLTGLLLASAPFASAQTNIYWRGAPGSASWGTATNWANTSGGTSGGTVPNSATATAIFGTSSRTSLTLPNNANYTIAGMSFAVGAPAYTFTLASNRALSLANGLVNNSTNAPTFAVAQGALSFNGGSAVDSAINITLAGTVNFGGSASAGTSSISLTDEASSLNFASTASAASSSITANEATLVVLNNTATLATSTLTLGGATLRLNNTATAADASLTATNFASVTLNDASTLGAATVDLQYSSLDAAGTASAGTSVITAADSYLTFADNSSLGAATVDLVWTDLTLRNNATAGSASITADYDSRVILENTATLATSTLALDGASLRLNNGSTAASATITATDYGYVALNDSATLGNATVDLSSSDLYAQDSSSAGASVLTATDSYLTFAENSSLGSATVDLEGANLTLQDNATATNATLTLVSSSVTFQGNATGGNAALVLDVDSVANFTESTHTAPSLGSLAGEGTVFLAGNTLSIGSDNTDTVFSGSIQPSYNLLSPTGAGINKVGTGNLTLSGVNTYTGDTTISGGTLTLGSATATGASTVVLNGGALGFGTATTANIGGLAGSGPLTLANTNAEAVTLTVGSNDLNTTYSGNLGGPGGLTKTGAGALTLSGANTQSGATTLNGGALRFTHAGALSANSNIQFDGGVIELVSGGPSDFTTGTGGGQVQWLTGGGFGASGGDRTVTLNGGAALTWGADHFVPGSATLTLGSATSDGTLTFANAIDLGSTARTIRVDRGTSSLDAILSGALTGSGGLVKTGAGSLALANATYTGATRLDGGSLRLDPSSQAPAGTNFVFNGGVLELGDGAPTDFTLGTGAGQVSWLPSSGGGFAAHGADRTVTLNGGANLSWGSAFNSLYTPITLGSASSDATITLANNIDYGNSPYLHIVDVHDGSAAIDGRLGGVISGTGAFAKRGAGTLALTAANTYAGATWLMGGSLEFSSLSNLGSTPSILFFGGTLRFAAGNTTDVSAYLNNTSAPGQIDTNGNDVTFATALGRYYLKSGAGTLTLTAADTTFTSLGVNGGALELRGSGTTGTNGDYYTEVRVARDAGTTGSLVVRGEGVTWSMPNIYLGSAENTTGGMTITDSATVSSFGLFGTSVGDVGAGSLSVLNGGSFATNYLTVGDGGAGAMLVDNGTVTTDSFLVIGGRATGTLTVQNGGTFTNTYEYGAELGYNGGAGTVNVTGAGSQFTVTGSIKIGDRGNGTLAISDGGAATSGESIVGYDGRAVGNVTVTGAGSVWNIAFNEPYNRALELAYRSNSTVTLADGGAINFTGSNREVLIGTTSTLNLGGGGVAADFHGIITNAGAIVVDNTNTVTISELVTGNDVAATFTKTGVGTALLAKGINGHTITINGGTLRVGDGTSVSNLGYDYAFNNGGALVLDTSYAFASLGTLTGAGSLTFQGGGTLTLSSANTHTGATTVNAGTLRVNHAAALGSTAAGTTVNSGAALHLGGVSLGAEALTLSGTGVGNAGALTGTGTSSHSGAITLADDASIGGTGNTLTLSGVIGESGGARALTKVGTGTLILSAANSYTGSTNVNAGTLSLTHADALGSTAAGTTVSSGAALNLNAISLGAEALTLSGTGVSNAGALTGTGTSSHSGAITLAADSSIGGTSNTLTLSGIIGESGGARALTKVGTGTLSLSGANTYTGATNVNAGTLSLTHADALGSTAAGTTVSSGAALNLNAISLGAEALTLSGAGIGNAGALTGTGTSSHSGAITLAANSSIGGTDNSLTLSGSIGQSGGTRSLTKVGNGTLVLSGANTHGGATTVSAGTLRATTVASALGAGTLALSGGALELANDSGLAFNRATTVSANTTITSDRLASGAGVTHTLGTLSLGAQTLALARGANVASGTAGLAFGNVTLSATGATFTANAGTRLTLGAVAPNTGNRSFTVNGAGDTAITGAITTGSGTLAKAGSGALTLSGANTYTGTTTVSAGTLQLARANSLLAANWTAPKLVVESGATVALNVGGAGEFTTANVASLSALGTASGGFKNGATLALDTSNASGAFEHTSGITNTNGGANVLALAKLGSGTLVLSGANTYAGATSINAGTLALGASATLGDTPVITIAEGAAFDISAVNGGFTLSAGQTIRGAGSIVGALSLGVGAHLAPGNSPGTLTFDDGLNLAGGSFLDFELGLDSDLIVIADGNLSFSGTGPVTINLTDSGGFGIGDYVLIDANAAALSNIHATSFTLGDTVEGYSYSIVETDRRFILNVAAIPEPATAAALLGLASLGLAASRRRRTLARTS